MIADILAVALEIGLEMLAAGGLELLASATPVPPAQIVSLAPSVERPRTFEDLEARVLGVGWAETERLRSLAEMARIAPDRSHRALLLLLQDSSPGIRAAAVEQLGLLRVRIAYSTIALMRGSTPAEEAAVVLALGRLGGAHAERRILRFLDLGSPQAQLAAAKALARMGTLHSVEKLRPHADAWFAGELGASSAMAISLIQRRHSRAAPGALSEASGGGELSAPAPRGALSKP